MGEESAMDEQIAMPASHLARADETDAFAARRFEGRGGFLSYMGGAVQIFVIWQIAVIPLVLTAVFFGYPGALDLIMKQVNWVDIKPEQDGDALVACAVLLLSLVVLLFVTWGTLKFNHKRSLLSVLTAHDRFQWGTAVLSFAIFVLAMVIVSLVSAFAGVGGEAITVFDAKRWLPFFLLVIVLTPFQALAEEAFVRGYLFQGVSALTKSTVLRIALPAFLFMLMHSANGDFMKGGIWVILILIGFGAYFGILTVRTSGVEAATGAHTANNIFAFSVSTSSGSGMPFATIFHDPAPDYMAGFVSIMAVAALHYVLFFGARRLRLLLQSR